MVQIIGPSPRAMQAEKIGQALGLGLGKQLGLQEAEQAASSAGGDPVKLAFSLARASTYAPELQKSLGQIYEQLLAKSQSNQLGSGLSGRPQNIPGSINTPNASLDPYIDNEINPKGTIPPTTDAPSNASPINMEISEKDTLSFPSNKKYTPDDIDTLSHQFLVDMRPDLVEGSSQYGRIPTFNYEMKSNLRPEEEGQLRQRLQSQGIQPRVIDQIIEKTREDINTRYNEYLKNFGFDQQRQETIRNKWSIFKSEADKNLVPFIGKYSGTFGIGGRPATSNDLRNKYFQYAGNLPVNLTPEQMHAQASALLQNDVNRIDALASIPSLPAIRDPQQVDEYINANKEAYKQLYNEGFYETLKEDAANKDMGIEELHYTIWGDQTDKNTLKELAKHKAPQVYLNGDEEELYALFSTKKLIANKHYPTQRKKYIDELSKSLLKIKKDDDLIILRSQILNQGGKEKDFDDALIKAIQNGLELSPFQLSQKQEVRIPRQRPLWEIFNPEAWKSWINLKRGKR